MVPAAGGALQECSLTADDWQAFEASLRALAASRERQAGTFERFAEYVQTSGHDVFLDGANIGYFNSNWIADPAQKFQWAQVRCSYRSTGKV